MRLETGSNFGKIEGYLSELRPENVIVKPSERISIDSQIMILVLAIGISIYVEWKKFGAKKVGEKSEVGSNLKLENGEQKIDKAKVLQSGAIESGLMLEEDRQQLEEAYLLNQSIVIPSHMVTSIAREERVSKFYSEVFGND
jgi:hypothetical protein